MQKRKFNRKKKEAYAFPVPEREEILAWLEAQGKPVTFKKLLKAFNLSHEGELEGFEYRLKAMLRDGQLVLDRRARYCLASKLDLIKGTIIAHPEGFGFLKQDDGGEDLYLSPRQMRRVFHGDRVLAQALSTTRRGKGEAQITDIIDRRTDTILGRLVIERGCAFIEALRKEIHHDLYVPEQYLKHAKNGDLVNTRVIVQPDQHIQPIVEIIEILSESTVANSLLYEIALKIYDIPADWDENIQTELTDIPETVSETDKADRTDLRNLAFVTIDGEDARDFDDAVYCKPLPTGGWILYVAIADVSHYVTVDSALDDEAQTRGNSVYFPSRVTPMLPESLSNGLCSLKPAVDRLTLVCEMKIGPNGRLGRYRFYDAVICSKARLTYTDVSNFLEKNTNSQINPDLHDDLLNLNQLYKILLKSRQERGALELDTVEPFFELNDSGEICSIYAKKRNDAHRLIEECMLLANVAAARLLKKSGLPAIYRNHEKPEEERLQTLTTFLSGLGLKIQGGKKPQTKDYTNLLAQIRPRDDFEMIQLVLLRSLNQAVYAAKNVGHFGLAYPAYTHFTSPIRRYPDLLVHRMIKHFVSNQPPETFPYIEKDLNEIAQSCSTTERRADEATRFVIDTLKCQFMSNKVGSVFHGKIVSVTKFGVFVRLDNFFIEGLLHITALDQDYYHFDPVKNQLTGERTGQVYRLLQAIEVRLVRVSEEERQIDFHLASETPGE